MPSKDDKPLTAAEMLAEAQGAPAVEAVAPADEPEGLTDEAMAALRAEGIDPFHAILTVDEQREAIAAAHKRVSKDAKADAKKMLEQQIYDAERGKTGLRTGNPMLDELVTCTLDLAEHSDCIRINGHQFWHGHTYTVPRHVANSLREMQQRGHHHQADIDGKGIAEKMKKPLLTAVVANPKTGAILAVHNAPQAA
jgi:cell division septum initiation protein DivIVA